MNVIAGKFCNWSNLSSGQSLFLQPNLQWKPDHIGFWFDDFISLQSLQRHITPEDVLSSNPCHDKESGVVLCGDIYLIQREDLAGKLRLPSKLSDAELCLKAYMRWGEQCFKHITGYFSIAVWDSKKCQLLLAVDHFANRPCFYYQVPGKQFLFSNHLSWLTESCKTLSPNIGVFEAFALQEYSTTDTCYTEIKKIPPAHYLIITPEKSRMQCYWKLSQCRQRTVYKTREEYYHAFQEIFHKSIADSVRAKGLITTEVSGGLDSSSVSAITSTLLAQQNRSLLGVTAVPTNMQGPSYRKGWRYHEMPIVQEILSNHTNIKHISYCSNPEENVYTAMSRFQHGFDQPFRAVANFDWLHGHVNCASQNLSRIIVTGQSGNGTVSWPGVSLRQRISSINKRLFSPRAQAHLTDINPAFLRSKRARETLANQKRNLHTQNHALTRVTMSSVLPTIYAIDVFYGIERLDPCGTLPIVNFCYNVPQWVYKRSNKVLGKRLLVREGLEGIVPSCVRFNHWRGEQAPDWIYQYNYHNQQWKKQVDGLSQDTKSILWHIYDKQYIEKLLHSNCYIAAPSKELVRSIRIQMMRFLSAAFFLEFVLTDLATVAHEGASSGSIVMNHPTQ